MENTNEIWKPVVGYEGLYECSNMGRVRTVGNNKTKIVCISQVSLVKNTIGQK